jgi:serine protease Do
MNRATQAVIAAIILAAFAMAQDQAPPAPEAPAAPAAPRAPRAPRAPKAPRAPESRSYLGIDSRDVTPEIASALHLPNTQGVEVMMVDQDAPAGKAGLKEHDVIVGFNGKPVSDPYELRNMIREVPPGNTATLGIVRGGKPMDVKVTLAEHPVFMGGPIHIPKIVIPPMPEIDVPVMMMLSRRNGMTVEPLTKQLAEAFGAKDGRGVLIRAVEKNSPAENAGFRAGDVIVRVGDEPIDSINDWSQALRQPHSGATRVNVTVIRERREQNFTLALPEKRSDNSALDLNLQFGDINAQLADIGPEIQKSMAEWQKEWNSEENQAELRKQMEEAQREARKAMQMNRAEIQKEMEKARREAEKARKDWQKQSDEWRQEWQKESQQDPEQ